jgi:hypothetical protein
MSEFDQSKWRKNQLLEEAGLLNENQVSQVNKAISDAIKSIDDSLSYRVLATAVAQILQDEYGTHNIEPFMKVLHAELGIGDSLNEEVDEKKIGEDFSNEFNVRARSQMRNNGSEGKIEIYDVGRVGDSEFETMINFIEEKGFKVDREQSTQYLEIEPGERSWFPTLKFSKS